MTFIYGIGIPPSETERYRRPALCRLPPPAFLEAEQNSLELRYSGRFGKANITTGAYYFDNDIAYHERRDLLGALTAQLTGGALGPEVSFQIQDGGGNYEVETLGLFGALDYDLTDSLTLTAGLRYTEEDKSAEIATLALNTNVLDIPATLGTGTLTYANPINGMDTRCNIVLRNDCPLDFQDDDSWTTWSPKLGLTYILSDTARVYGHWTRGFRSGGYNLRNTSPVATPGPFDEEQVDSFEIGYKSTHSWGRLNAAVFYTEVDDMQREVNTASGESAVVQVIDNTADATLTGLELDASFRLSDSLLLLASLGYIDAEYDSVRFDLNGDGDINAADEELDLPRAPELTYSIGLNYDWDIGSWGYATARVSYAYRDDTFFTDDNRGLINEQDILDAGVDFYSNDESWVFSLYGRNLLDTVKHGGATQLPQAFGPLPLGGTFAPLAKGEVYGAEVTYNF